MTREEINDGVKVGMALAASILMTGHGEDTLAEEILVAAGVCTDRAARALGLDDYDLKALAPVFEELARKAALGIIA